MDAVLETGDDECDGLSRQVLLDGFDEREVLVVRGGDDGVDAPQRGRGRVDIALADDVGVLDHHHAVLRQELLHLVQQQLAEADHDHPAGGEFHLHGIFSL